MAKSGANTGKGRHKPKGKTRADKADPKKLYEQAVQSPDSDIEFFIDTYQRLRGREPVSLREDFCGSAKLATTWCLDRAGRRAVGVDIDEPTLEWGRNRNIVPYWSVPRCGPPDRRTRHSVRPAQLRTS